jgi:predicted flavoprotein YhiN
MGAGAPEIAIFGAGPAGLFAAETAATGGARVTVYDKMRLPGRKFLLAGRGGLNLTHAEPLEKFVTRYREGGTEIQPYILDFGPEQLRAWAHGLGQDTFIGSSDRVYPRVFKASPLLRAWLARLDALGVRFVGDSSLREMSAEGATLLHNGATRSSERMLTWWRWAAALGRNSAAMGRGRTCSTQMICAHCSRQMLAYAFSGLTQSARLPASR